MKKMPALALIAMMLLTFVACGGEEPAPATEPTAPILTEAPTQAPTEAPTEEPDPITATDMAETVLFDDENCSFTVSLASENAHLGMTLDALCVNKTDKTLMFTWNTVSVCGYLYDPLWSQEVAPGESVTSVVYIDTFQLEQLGITSIDEIEFTLYIFDSGDFMAQPYANDVFTIYPTGLDEASVVYPERISVDGEQVITGDNNVDFIIEGFEESGGTYALRCYLGNRTDANLVYAWEDVTVNGSAIDPMFALEVPAGKQTYGEVSFFLRELKAQGISDVEEITFRLNVTDSATGEAVLDQVFTFRAEDSLVG
ncbi:MAG: hypothetical protein J6B95_03185 [Oscillospiraceae bacterium]|nr:hypothetical protein [Oscillospiraceae bacterium]